MTYEDKEIENCDEECDFEDDLNSEISDKKQCSDGKQKKRKLEREESPPMVILSPKEIVEKICSGYRFVVNYGYFEVKKMIRI